MTDGYVLAYYVADHAGFLPHLDLELLGLYALSSDLGINFFLLRDKIICRLFCLCTKICQSTAILEAVHYLLLGCYFFLDEIDLLVQSIGIKVH